MSRDEAARNTQTVGLKHKIKSLQQQIHLCLAFRLCLYQTYSIPKTQDISTTNKWNYS